MVRFKTRITSSYFQNFAPTCHQKLDMGHYQLNSSTTHTLFYNVWNEEVTVQLLGPKDIGMIVDFVLS